MLNNNNESLIITIDLRMNRWYQDMAETFQMQICKQVIKC